MAAMKVSLVPDGLGVAAAATMERLRSGDPRHRSAARNILAKLGYEANGHRVDLGYERGRDEADRLIKMNMGLAGDELHPLEVSRDSVNLKYTTTEATDYWDPEIAVYYTQNDYWRNNYAARTNGNMNLNEDLFGGKAQNTFTTDYGKITAGFDVGQHNYHTDNYGNNNRQYRDFDTLQTGAFVQGRFEFDNSFKVSTGARLDHHRFTDWDDNAFPFRRQPTSRSPMRSTKTSRSLPGLRAPGSAMSSATTAMSTPAPTHSTPIPISNPVARRISRSAPISAMATGVAASRSSTPASTGCLNTPRPSCRTTRTNSVREASRSTPATGGAKPASARPTPMPT